MRFLAKDREDVGSRMSAVFLAKVEVKEKEDKSPNKNNDQDEENKGSKKPVSLHFR